MEGRCGLGGISGTVGGRGAGVAGDRSRVRLWAMGPDGQRVTAILSGVDVARLKTKSAIARELSDRLAQRIAQLFYDHTPRDSDARR